MFSSTLKWIVRPRYWFLRTTQMHRYKTYEDTEPYRNGFYNYKADIKSMPSFTGVSRNIPLLQVVMILKCKILSDYNQEGDVLCFNCSQTSATFS